MQSGCFFRLNNTSVESCTVVLWSNNGIVSLLDMHDLTLIMVNYQVNVLNSVLFRIEVIRPVLAQPKSQHIYFCSLSRSYSACKYIYSCSGSLHKSHFTCVLIQHSFNWEQINTNQQTAEQQRWRWHLPFSFSVYPHQPTLPMAIPVRKSELAVIRLSSCKTQEQCNNSIMRI